MGPRRTGFESWLGGGAGSRIMAVKGEAVAQISGLGLEVTTMPFAGVESPGAQTDELRLELVQRQVPETI